jgi:CheY-like chemotaxis protein
MSLPQPARNRRVLVVDDDPQVHLLIGNALTTDGGRPAESPLRVNTFEVTVASHGAEAEALTRAAEEAHRPFALGFVELVTPLPNSSTARTPCTTKAPQGAAHGRSHIMVINTNISAQTGARLLGGIVGHAQQVTRPPVIWFPARIAGG